MSSYGQHLLRAYIETMLEAPTEILEDHRPDWMDGLELDLYLPEHDLAFEFQGDQHFVPVRGEDQFGRQVQNDSAKKRICWRRGTPLIQVTAGDLDRRRLIRRIGEYAGAYGRRGKQVRKLFRAGSPVRFRVLDLKVREYQRTLERAFQSVTTKRANASHWAKVVRQSLASVRV